MRHTRLLDVAATPSVCLPSNLQVAASGCGARQRRAAGDGVHNPPRSCNTVGSSAPPCTTTTPVASSQHAGISDVQKDGRSVTRLDALQLPTEASKVFTLSMAVNLPYVHHCAFLWQPWRWAAFPLQGELKQLCFMLRRQAHWLHICTCACEGTCQASYDPRCWLSMLRLHLSVVLLSQHVLLHVL